MRKRDAIRFLLFLLLTAATADDAYGQNPNRFAEEGLKAPSSCQGREGLAMTVAEKTCYWSTHTFNAQAIFGAAFNAGIAQLRQAPREWELGASGYGKRVGTRLTQGFAKGTAQYLGGVAFKEDPRYRSSAKKGAWARIGYALGYGTVLVHGDAGGTRPAIGRLAGAMSSGWVARSWTPDRVNTAGAAWRRSATALSGSVSSSFFKEFRPELSKLARFMFRAGPRGVPSQPNPALAGGRP